MRALPMIGVAATLVAGAGCAREKASPQPTPTRARAEDGPTIDAEAARDASATATTGRAPPMTPPTTGGPTTTTTTTATAAATTTSADEEAASDAARDAAIARALAPDLPTAVLLVAAQPYRGGHLVLVGVDEAARWEQGLGDDRARLDAFDAAAAACEDGASEFAVTECILEAAPTPYVGWSRAGADVRRLEVAYLRGAENLTVVARRELIDLAVLGGVAVDDEVAVKLKAYDVDRDGHDEVTVIAPIGRPTADSFTEIFGAVGAILDIRELRPQFTTSRLAIRDYSHADDAITEEVTVRWLAKAEGEAPHPSLRVREVIKHSERPTQDRTLLCPYDPAADAWRCPEALTAGDALLRGEPLDF